MGLSRVTHPKANMKDYDIVSITHTKVFSLLVIDLKKDPGK